MSSADESVVERAKAPRARERFQEFEQRLHALEGFLSENTRGEISTNVAALKKAQELLDENKKQIAEIKEIVDDGGDYEKAALDLQADSIKLKEECIELQKRTKILNDEAAALQVQRNTDIEELKTLQKDVRDMSHRKELAHSFGEAATRQKRQADKWSLVLGGIVVLAIGAGFSSVHWEANGVSIPKDLTELIIGHSWYMLPLGFAAIFSSAQASRHKTIYQDYLYKQAMGYAYEGYKREVEGDEDMESELLKGAVENFNKNPVYLVPHTENESWFVQLAKVIWNKKP